MLLFDDFDAWADAISGASLRLVCDAVETRRWTLGRMPLGDLVLQVASEGGGNLCYGENTHSGPMLSIPLSHAAAHVVNAERLDVTGRTLLRTFRETYGVPPKQYLMFRELHGIRRILRAGAPLDGTVADVLTRHGIWEFGRFAARYRRQFGELPSMTLRRVRS